MNTAFVLLTGMPITKGHVRLVEFAQRLAWERFFDASDARVVVIVNTQPDEPMVYERVLALRQAVGNILSNVPITVYNIHKELPQEPAGHEGFWDMWRAFLVNRGLTPGSNDIIVASEMYGVKLASECEVDFFPYDIGRELLWTKATDVRRETRENFSSIAPEFQGYLRKTVTVFGAESTGKTTLSKALASSVNGHWLFEYARPYLETVGTDITVDSMTGIWKGQAALQKHAKDMFDKPFVVQDTDLYSTVGYWEFWSQGLGAVPANGVGGVPTGLTVDARVNKSDLYIITQSNIPFERDPLRYGGSEREASDAFWIGVCERYDLPYVVLQSSTVAGRLQEAALACRELFDESADVVDLGAYERRGQ